ncbi:MAG: hypothetical protein RLZ57_665 [Actinomycetota bacterium]
MKPKSTEDLMLRGALIPTLIVGLISLGIFTLRNGSSGLLGALFAEVVVILFFLVHILISRVSINLDPMATMALAMFSYFAKVLLMGAALFAISKFTNPETINRTAFGISAIALTFAWLGGEIRAYFKLRVTLDIPKDFQK